MARSDPSGDATRKPSSRHAEAVARLRDTLDSLGRDDTVAAGQTLGRLGAPGRVRPSPAVVGVGDDADFALRGELGRGGMGVVYLARQASLNRDVAVKRLDQALPAHVDALLREAAITGGLEHPSIVPVHAVVEDERGPAVVMKRVTGEPWSALLARPEVPLDAHLDVILQVANALAFAHSRGVVHRDVKPDNVMVGAFGEVYLVDWGISRRLAEEPDGRVVGTPAYMAPEMGKGLADERTDVYLLGACLHHALTGAPRHPGEELWEVFLLAMDSAPHPYGPDVPEELGQIANRACAPLPDDRFPSVTALREALVAFREHRSSRDLAEAARARLEELEATLAAPPVDDVRVQSLFGQARFGFEQAIHVWPGNADAIQGLDALLARGVEHELDRERPDAAEALLEAMAREPPGLRARAAAVRAALEEREARISLLERDQDRTVGAERRERAYQLLALAALAVTAHALARRLETPDFAPSTERLAVIGCVVFGAMALIVLWWRRAGWNLVNRRIAQITILTLGTSMLQRLAAVVAGTPPAQVLITDAFLIGAGAVALSAFHRAGPVLAALCLGVAGAGSVWPAIVDDLFVALSVLVPSVMLVSWRRGRREIAAGGGG